MAVVRPEVGVWRERNKTGKRRRSARCHVCGVGTPEGGRKGRTVDPSKGRKKQREFLGGGYLFEGRPVTKSEAHKGGHRTKEAWSGKRRKGKGEADERDDETDGSGPYKCAEVKRPNVVPGAPIDSHIGGAQ
ncbi:hypothetical protein BHM03_00011695 [Ensete ventricosum]|nr:hypothetical protein BHM03_00011695 [Ensete ventricosum]